MRLRYVRPGNGYDANDFTLAQNKVVFDSANPGIFSIFASGLWRGSIAALTSRTQIVSWPTLSYIPICTFALNTAQTTFSDTANYGFYTPTISNFQNANDDYGLDVYYDGIYWRYNGGTGALVGNLDKCSLWWWAHRMPAV